MTLFTGPARFTLRRTAWASLAMLALSPVVPALAQDVPSAALLQEIERRAGEIDRQTTPVQEGDPVLTDPLTRAELPPPGGPTVLLNAVVFDPPSEFLSDLELDAIVERYLGQRLDFSRIANLVRDVNDLYAEKGIVTASAILPPQELADGVLHVQLVEGRAGAIAILGERRTKDEFILDRVRLTRGNDVVDVPTAADDILRFNATHRAQLRMLLQPGAAFGLTDIILGITEPSPELFQLQIDNHGTQSTGEFRLNALYRRYGALQIDDSLMLFLSGAGGSLAGTVNYDLPIGTLGTRLAVGYTASAIEVILGPTAPLGVTGASQAASATITHPLHVSSDWIVQGLASLSHGTNTSTVSDVMIVDSSTTKAAVGLSIDHMADWGKVSVLPQLVHAGAHDLLTDEWREILLFVGSTNLLYRLNDDFSVVGRGSWQVTEAQLMPGDLLYQIGGPTTVRGYPSSGVAGDSGYSGQVELHWATPIAEMGAFVFTDFGEVFSTFPDRTTLLSAGVGVAYTTQDGVSLDAALAFPLIDAMSDQQVAALYASMVATID